MFSIKQLVFVHNPGLTTWREIRASSFMGLHLVQESENNGIWTLFASIFPENTASIRLHVRHGFREIGIREKIAMLDGKWRDPILFECRSKIVGN